TRLRKVPLGLVAIGLAGVGEKNEAERIVDLQTPLEVHNVVLVPASRLKHAAVVLGRADRAELEAAHRVLAADEEALRLRNAERVVLFDELRAAVGAVLVEREDAS